MSLSLYSALYDNLPFPTIVCSIRNQTVLYINSEAKLLLERAVGQGTPLQDALGCSESTEFNTLIQTIALPESAQFFRMTIQTGQGRNLSVLTRGNILDSDDATLPAVLYFYDDTRALGEGRRGKTVSHIQEFLFTIIHNFYHSTDADTVINSTLSMVGNFIDADRTYLFETQKGLFSNTYEWCSSKVKPQIAQLQNMTLESLTINKITNGLFIVDDVSKLEESERKIVEPQGIKAMMIIPLLEGKNIIGFIGCDDCSEIRTWQPEEIQLLQIIARVIMRVLLQKRAETSAHEYQNIMQTILDTMKSLIYVADFETREILFANKAVREMAAIPKGEKIEGKLCWKTIQKNQTAPCSFCHLKTAFDPDGNLSEPCAWEFQNTLNNHWYLVRDYPIRWVDGRYVHMEVATEITNLKEKEKELREFASIDRMTGIYNREWGYSLLEKAMLQLKESKATASLCFIDLDGLKKVNDTYGHNEGDIMISTFVSAIKAFTRGADIFCRWGGDEFLLLLDDCTPANAKKVIGKIEKSLEAINKQDMHPYEIAFSCGVKGIDSNTKEERIDEIICIADERMYLNKAKKRGSAAFPE